jgi:hypothetical protein
MISGLVITIVVTGIGAYMMWGHIKYVRKTRCPQCRQPRLVIQPVERIDEVTRLRCAACRSEFCKDSDRLWDRATYEAAHPAELPKAQARPRRVS